MNFLKEELLPFTNDFYYDIAPVLDDDDLKKAGMYSDESLTQKYRKNAETVKQASPPLDQTEKMNPKLDEYAEKVQRLLGSERPLLGNQMSSNHWVVHGNHTETGMPLFSSDPHLENQIPSTWLLFNL